ncbi:hypothetical protein C8Q80DRAFT_1269958 [Daedaleopsis nitida]|nr:hypothetical protein C8Q80DRAFT_1269958 [Daedaleopsis nitida]
MASSPSPKSIAAANLGAVCLQSALYGIFLVLSAVALVLLALRHGGSGSGSGFAPARVRAQSRWGVLASPLFAASAALLAMVLVQWGLSVFRAFDAFIYTDGGRAPADYFLDFTRWSEVAVNALTVFAQVICDGMITYRTWVVWNRDWRAVALPLLALLALMAGCIGLVYEETHVSSVFAEDAKRWITADAILTVCINIYGTGLTGDRRDSFQGMIAYRIWAATRNTKRMGPGARSGTLQRVLGVFIESAALYTCWTLFFILTYQRRSTLHYPGSSSWPQVSGIAYMLITVRIGLGWAHEDRAAFSPAASASATATGTGTGRGTDRHRVAHPLRTIYIGGERTGGVDIDIDIGMGMGEDADADACGRRESDRGEGEVELADRERKLAESPFTAL